MHCSIDIQGFSGLKIANQLMPKEVAVRFSSGSEFVFSVESEIPFPFLTAKQRRIVHWTVLTYNALGYSTGTITEKVLHRQLREITEDCEKIVTKGRQKKKYLEDVLCRPVLDLGDIGCPLLRPRVSTRCPKHFKPDVRCAVAGAEDLLSWYNEHLRGDGLSGEAKQDDGEPVQNSSVCEQRSPEKDQASSSTCN